MPSIFWIAKAKSPENAPAREAALKKTAMRVCSSSRLYHVVRRYVLAGKKPVSAKPSYCRWIRIVFENEWVGGACSNPGAD